MPRRVKKLLVAGLITFAPSFALAQSSADAGLTTPAGHDITIGFGAYKYVEPGDTSISIHGPKFALGYTGTASLNKTQHWFLQGDVRTLLGKTTYDGWCAPFLITPYSPSPNGYALGLGDFSPCSESGDKDWYVEGRALLGKDFVGRTWGWSPEIGLGVRHLSNGIAGVNNYRSDDYLYLPLGISARTLVGARRTLGFTLEYDHLLHGWQTTRDSQLGGGAIPATPTTPAFTLDGFTDISFDQHSGWAIRASAKYQLARHWSLEPEYIHWNVDESPVNYEMATFTVNGITAQQQLGAYEPTNHTNEFTVNLGIRF